VFAFEGKYGFVDLQNFQVYMELNRLSECIPVKNYDPGRSFYFFKPNPYPRILFREILSYNCIRIRLEELCIVQNFDTG
jgi:hypothetical protein